MGSISVSKDISINFENNEIDSLKKSFDILKDVRHQLFLKDDDSDMYWCIDSTLMGLRDILKSVGIAVEY